MRSDHWFFEVFQALPDLVRHLIVLKDTAEPHAPELEPPGAKHPKASRPELARINDTSADGDESTYIFKAEVLKRVSHNLDGVFWPRRVASGSPTEPVVLLEVQMHSDPLFHRRLGAETFRFLQQHNQVAHLEVLVLIANAHLTLGRSNPSPLQRFLQQDVTWVDLEALALHDDLDPLLSLLTLPVRRDVDLGSCCLRILQPRPDLIELILPILSERFQTLSLPQIMASLGISLDSWRHTHAFQEILREGREEGRQAGHQEGLQQGLQEGRQEGRQEGHQEGRQEGLEEGLHREACALALRLLERRFGALSPDVCSSVGALNRSQLEALALDLLDFGGVDDLLTWLEGLEG